MMVGRREEGGDKRAVKGMNRKRPHKARHYSRPPSSSSSNSFFCKAREENTTRLHHSGRIFLNLPAEKRHKSDKCNLLVCPSFAKFASYP